MRTYIYVNLITGTSKCAIRYHQLSYIVLFWYYLHKVCRTFCGMYFTGIYIVGLFINHNFFYKMTNMIFYWKCEWFLCSEIKIPFVPKKKKHVWMLGEYTC